MGNWWLCLFLCFWVVSSQEPPHLRVKFNHVGILYSQKNGNLTVGCEINRNMGYITVNNVSITRKSAIEGTEAILAQFPNNVNKDNNYSTDPQPVPGNGVLINITILKVRDLDEGKFICRVLDSSGISAEDYLQIELEKPLKNVYLEFNGNSPISKTMADPFEVFTGSYSVICFANGSNPAPSVNLFVDGNEAENVDHKTELLATKLTEYKTTVNATISIKFSTSLQEIKCNGTTQLEDEHSVVIYVKTKIRDPDVDCSETKAQKGQKHPVLICTVQYEGVNITNYTYSEGTHTVPFNFHNVRHENLSETEVRVNLTLDEAKDWHFQNFYLLLTHLDGHVTRVSVKLHNSEGQPNSSTSVQFMLMTMLLCLVSWLILPDQASGD